MNLFCDDFIDMPFFFQVRWGSGSIVSVRWVHLDNPRLWECGNEWECNAQTASTLPHQSDYKIHFYDLMWPSLILHCSSALPAFILVHNDLSIRSDSAGLLENVFEGFLLSCFEVSTPAFSSECHHPHKDFLFVPTETLIHACFVTQNISWHKPSRLLWCHLANETPTLVMRRKGFCAIVFIRWQWCLDHSKLTYSFQLVAFMLALWCPSLQSRLKLPKPHWKEQDTLFFLLFVLFAFPWPLNQ